MLQPLKRKLNIMCIFYVKVWQACCSAPFPWIQLQIKRSMNFFIFLTWTRILKTVRPDISNFAHHFCFIASVNLRLWETGTITTYFHFYVDTLPKEKKKAATGLLCFYSLIPRSLTLWGQPAVREKTPVLLFGFHGAYPCLWCVSVVTALQRKTTLIWSKSCSG